MADPVAMLEFQIKAAKLPAPVLECKFHPERKWRFDLAWPAQNVALEIDGGIWMRGGGAHSRPANILRDIEKINAAQELGWKVYRATPDMVKSGAALGILERVLK